MQNIARPLMAFSLSMIVIAGCGGNWSDGETTPPLPAYPPIPAGLATSVKTQLETLAGSSEPLERAHAALLLGKEGKDAEAAVPYLLVALEDPDHTVRADAAEALGKLGDARAVEPLIAILKDTDEDWGVRARAAWSLGKLHDARATGPLVAALADMVSHVRLMAATALGEIGDPAAEEALQSTARHDSDLSVRYAAKDALKQIRQAAARKSPAPAAEN